MQSSAFKDKFLNPAGQEIAVEMQRLDEYIDEFFIDTIDLLKMDIEGMEFNVLLDLDESYFKKITSLVIEYHLLDDTYTEKYDQLLSKIKNLYKTVEILPNPYSKKL